MPFARRRCLVPALVLCVGAGICVAAGTASLAFGGDGPAPAPAAGPAPAPETPRPRIVFDRTSHDFGAVKQHTDAKTRFSVRNEGSAPLEIGSLKGDCGCAIATVSKTKLGVGESATIDVVFSTHTFFGRQKKTIRVTSNDPEAKQTDLVLTVDVSAGIVLQPAYFSCGMTLVGTLPTATVKAEWREGTGKKFAIKSVECPDLPDTAFDWKAFEAPPWRGWEITLRFKKAPPVGTFFAQATIHTDDSENSALVAEVSGAVSGRVVLTQRVVTFGQVRQGVGGRREVLCRGYDASIALGDVTATSASGIVKASVRPDEKDPAKYVIEIRLPETTPPGAIVDFVDVHTKVPGEEHLQVKVVGTVLPAAK